MGSYMGPIWVPSGHFKPYVLYGPHMGVLPTFSPYGTHLALLAGILMIMVMMVMLMLMVMVIILLRIKYELPNTLST